MLFVVYYSERSAITGSFLEAILEGMKDVTSERGGTAYSIFKDFNITIGGKTGSAQTGSGTNAWFVGFAPYDEPEIAVVVMVEKGGHGYYTGEVVRDIMTEYFGMNIQEVVEEYVMIRGGSEFDGREIAKLDVDAAREYFETKRVSV